MYDTIEEIDEALKKLNKRRKNANELTSSGTWGGLLRGSTSIAGINEQEQYLLRRKEKLIERGHTINVAFYFSNAEKSLRKLSNFYENTDNMKLHKELESIIEKINKIKKENL